MLLPMSEGALACGHSTFDLPNTWLRCSGSTCILPDETLEAFQAAVDDGASFISMHVVRFVCSPADAHFSAQCLSPPSA